jgi:outer membrane protein OmpU
MKRLLLGSTALASAVAFAAPAFAEQGIELGLGGRYAAAAGVLFSQDSGSGEQGANTSSEVLRQDVEVYFQGSATLDNGLKVGVELQLEGQQSNDQIDEVYAFFESERWGQIRFGDTPEALGQLCYLVPVAGNLFGVDSPYFDFNNAGRVGFANTNSTCLGLDDNATKIVYFSPSFGGFSFALSWTPDRRGEDTYSGFGGATGGFGGGGTTGNNNPGQVEDNFSAAITYSHDFEDFSLLLGGGASHADWEAPASGQDKGTENYNAYAQVSFGGWLVGGSFGYISNWNSSSPNELDLWVAGVGVTYSWDEWTAGLAYSHGHYEMNSPGDDDTLDIVQAQLSYALAEGISIDGMIGYAAYADDHNNAPNGDYQAVEAGLGFFIEF